MAEHDWGADHRRVRPLPPEAGSPDPAGPPSSPNVLAYMAVALTLVLTAGWLVWPESDTPSRRAAAPVTTTEPPPTTVPAAPAAPPATAVTVPPPPQPVQAETELGVMTWQLVSPTGSAAARWVTNPVWTGDEFVYLAGSDGLTLNRSPDGLGWDSARTDFDTTEAGPLELVATDDGLLMTGFGFGRPRAWLSRNGTRWHEVDLSRLRPPDAGPISIQWDWTVEAAPLPGGSAVLWTGAWFAVRWDMVLGRDVFDFEQGPESGRLVVRASPGDPGTEYEVTLAAADGAVHLTVRAADTGAVVHDSVSAVGGFDADLAASALRDNLATQAWRPLGWIIDAAGEATLLQPGVGGFPAGSTWFTATDDGLIAGTSTYVSASPQPQTFVARSADGLDWEVLPGGAFPAEAWIAGAASDGDVAVLAGSMWQTVQLAEQVSARSQIGVALRSDNGMDWEVHEARFPAGAFELGGFGGGPLGFAAVNFECPAGCSYQAWLSADGRTWSRVTLPSPGFGRFPLFGVAVSTDRVVIIGAAEDDFGIFTAVRAWVGEADV